MARLVGLFVLFWAVYASVGFSIANAPQPAAASTFSAEPQPSPLDALSDAAPDPVIGVDHMLDGPSWADGAYAVGDSPNRRIASRDRDYRPRTRIFVTETTSDADEDPDADDPDNEDNEDNDRNSNDRDDDELDDDDVVDAREQQVVKGEIPPGLYATSFDTEECRYELWRVLSDREPTVIAEEYLAEGRLLVTINGIEPDWFTTSDSCGEWRPWAPQPEPLTMAKNGDYWIGDLSIGSWYVPRGCQWEKVVGFRGGFLYDVLDHGQGPGTMDVNVDTVGVRIRGCRAPLTLSNADVELAS